MEINKTYIYGGCAYRILGSAVMHINSAGEMTYRALALNNNGQRGYLVYRPYDNHAEIAEEDEMCDWSRPDFFELAD